MLCSDTVETVCVYCIYFTVPAGTVETIFWCMSLWILYICLFNVDDPFSTETLSPLIQSQALSRNTKGAKGRHIFKIQVYNFTFNSPPITSQGYSRKRLKISGLIPMDSVTNARCSAAPPSELSSTFNFLRGLIIFTLCRVWSWWHLNHCRL